MSIRDNQYAGRLPIDAWNAQSSPKYTVCAIFHALQAVSPLLDLLEDIDELIKSSSMPAVVHQY